MWESFRSTIAEWPLYSAYAFSGLIMAIHYFAGRYRINNLSAEDIAQEESDDARQNRFTRSLEAGTVVVRTGFWLNASSCGAALLLISTLIQAGSDPREVIEVLTTFLFGIFFGILAVTAAHLAEAGPQNNRSESYRGFHFSFGLIALSHFPAGSIQLIDALANLAME